MPDLLETAEERKQALRDMIEERRRLDRKTRLRAMVEASRETTPEPTDNGEPQPARPRRGFFDVPPDFTPEQRAAKFAATAQRLVEQRAQFVTLRQANELRDFEASRTFPDKSVLAADVPELRKIVAQRLLFPKKPGFFRGLKLAGREFEAVLSAVIGFSMEKLRGKGALSEHLLEFSATILEDVEREMAAEGPGIPILGMSPAATAKLLGEFAILAGEFAVTGPGAAAVSELPKRQVRKQVTKFALKRGLSKQTTKTLLRLATGSPEGAARFAAASALDASLRTFAARGDVSDTLINATAAAAVGGTLGALFAGFPILARASREIRVAKNPRLLLGLPKKGPLSLEQIRDAALETMRRRKIAGAPTSDILQIAKTTEALAKEMGLTGRVEPPRPKPPQRPAEARVEPTAPEAPGRIKVTEPPPVEAEQFGRLSSLSDVQVRQIAERGPTAAMRALAEREITIRVAPRGPGGERIPPPPAAPKGVAGPQQRLELEPRKEPARGIQARKRPEAPPERAPGEAREARVLAREEAGAPQEEVGAILGFNDRKIVIALSGAKDGLTASELRSVVGEPAKIGDATLKNLENRGIIQLRKGRYFNTAKGQRVATPEGAGEVAEAGFPPTTAADVVVPFVKPKALAAVAKKKPAVAPVEAAKAPRKGETILLTAVTRQVGNIVSGTTEFGGAFGIRLTRLFQRGNTIIRKLGEPGKLLSEGIDKIAFNFQRRFNTSQFQQRNAIKGLGRTQREHVAMMADNYAVEAKMPDKVRADLFARSEKLRAIMDEQMLTFAKLGGQRRLGQIGARKVSPTGSGHSFPQVLNDRGRAVMRDVVKPGAISPRVMRAAEWMVEHRHAKSIIGAIRQMRAFNQRQLRNVNPYLERKRIPLPPWMREWDPNLVLPTTMQRNWMTIEGIREWGWDTGSQSFPKANELIERIRTTDPADATAIQEFIRLSFGQGSKASPSARLISEKLRGVQFFGKIALSPLTISRNMLDRYAKAGTTAGLLITIKATIKRPPIISIWLKSAKKLEDEMFTSGAVFGHGSIAEGVEPGTIIGRLIGAAFTASERGNQVFEALVARMMVERDIKAYLALNQKSRLGKLFQAVRSLNELSERALEVRLREAKLLDLSSEKLADLLVQSKGNMTPELIQAVMHRTVRDQAFPIILSTKRLWWDTSPGLRVAAQFKTWTVEQMGFIYKEAIIKSIETRSPLPLMRFVLFTAVVGEIYNIARDLLQDKEESLTIRTLRNPDMRNLHDVSWALWTDFLDGGGIGFLADLNYGLTDWVLGPTAGTVETVATAGVRSLARPELTPESVTEILKREIAGVRQARGIFNRIRAKHDKTTNDVMLYSVWRSREWDFIREDKDPTFADAAFELGRDIIFGRHKFEEGRRSFGYELAARNVITGNIDDAAGYLAMIINDGKTPGARALINRAIVSSRNRRAPMGRMNDDRRAKFLRTVTPEQRLEIRSFRARWLLRYDKAHARAKRLALQNRRKELLGE